MYDSALLNWSYLNLNDTAAPSHVRWETCARPSNLVIPFDTCVVQIRQLTGTATTWIATVERSNDGVTWAAMSTATTILAATTPLLTARIPIESRWMRVKTSTVQGAAATGEVWVYMTAENGTGRGYTGDGTAGSAVYIAGNKGL